MITLQKLQVLTYIKFRDSGTLTFEQLPKHTSAALHFFL